MTSRWNTLRRDFPLAKRRIYLDHASGGPIPVPVYRKLKEHYDDLIQNCDFSWPKWIKMREEARLAIARFINAEPEEITFVQSTSQGMNWIAEMLCPEGDVLLNDLEFPSSTLPWLWRGAKVVWQKSFAGQLCLRKTEALLGPRIKTVVTSYVQYGTGFKQDLQKLGKMKGSRYLVVNATQGFGVLPIDVKKWNADFLVTNSYKWLMAGYGGGVLYIKKKWLQKFKPSSVGWRSMKDPDAMNNQRLDIKEDAGRYEMGCPSFPVIFSVGQAVRYFSEIGIENIQGRVLELTDYLIKQLQIKKYEILSPLEKESRSGIVIFKIKNSEKKWKDLLSKNIFVSPRGGGLRVAPHFYNSREDLDQLLKHL